MFLAGRRSLIGKPHAQPSLLRHRRTGSPWWRADETPRHCLEVLHNGSEMKLVAGTGETTKAHTLKAMLDLQMCKTHLYFFARIARSLELRRALECRAWLRASSLISRAIFLNGARVHRCLTMQARQS